MDSLEILKANYWEHFKYAKDLQLILPLKHPKRVKYETILNEMILEINEREKEVNDLNSNKT